jgi:general secretion pathway protein I
MMSAARHGASGFSLIEALIALAVLAICSSSFLLAARSHISQVAGIERRALALIDAQNALALIAIGETPAAQTAPFGHVLNLSVVQETIEGSQLRRIDLQIDGDDGRRLVSLSSVLRTESLAP